MKPVPQLTEKTELGLLAQTLCWQARHEKGNTLELSLSKEALGEEHRELRDFRLDLPLEKWGLVIKHARNDRKLFGGVVLEFANEKDQLAIVLSNDRLFGELQCLVAETTGALVEKGVLDVAPSDGGN